MGELVFVLKDVDSIGKLKNGYHVLIVESLYPLLVGDIHYMLEVIMLPDTMIDFDKERTYVSRFYVSRFYNKL